MESVANLDEIVLRLPALAKTADPAAVWGVTPARIADVVRRIVDEANPQRVVMFGSWARGDARPDSDLDLAVTLDESSTVGGAGGNLRFALRLSQDVDGCSRLFLGVSRQDEGVDQQRAW